MRTFTATVQSGMNAEGVIIAALVTLAFDSGSLCVTNAPYTLTVSSQAYIGLGILGEISGIRESTDLSTDHLKLVLNGANSAIIAAALTEKPQGRPVTIRAAIFSGSYTVLADPMTVWDGVMDNFEFESYGGAESKVVLNVEHFLADRDRARVGRYNDSDHRAIAAHSGDLGFQYIETMTDATIRWGRP